MYLVDSHAHLDFVEDLPSVLDRAIDANVSKIITIGTSIKASKKCIEIAEKHSDDSLQIYATVGLHPQDGKDEVRKSSLYQCINTLKQIANSSSKVIGIGECGLDYYLGGEKRIPTVDKDKQFQRKLFAEQIRLAADLKLPLVIHCRNAWSKIFDLLSTVNRELSTITGVFHSFTGNWLAAQKALDLGFYLSFSGIVTFKNDQEIQEVAKKAPLNRILIETDSPFLTPSPFRGEQNEPKNVKIIGKFLAEIRKESLDLISSVTTANAVKLFKL